MSIESVTHDFLKAAIDGAVSGPLFGADLHETCFQDFEKDFGVRVGDCESSLAPLAGAGEVAEFDGLLSLVCFARVAGPDTSDRTAARDQAFEIAKAVSALFLDNAQMGDRVDDSRALRVARGYDSFGGEDYAVCSLQVIVNETGNLTV